MKKLKQVLFIPFRFIVRYFNLDKVEGPVALLVIVWVMFMILLVVVWTNIIPGIGAAICFISFCAGAISYRFLSDLHNIK